MNEQWTKFQNRDTCSFISTSYVGFTIDEQSKFFIYVTRKSPLDSSSPQIEVFNRALRDRDISWIDLIVQATEDETSSIDDEIEQLPVSYQIPWCLKGYTLNIPANNKALLVRVKAHKSLGRKISVNTDYVTFSSAFGSVSIDQEVQARRISFYEDGLVVQLSTSFQTFGKSSFIVSLPGETISVKLRSTVDYTHSHSVHVYWLDKIYNKHKTYSVNQPSMCAKLNYTSYCLNFSFPKYNDSINQLQNSAYYVFYRQLFIHTTKNMHLILGKSWDEASNLCRSAGGHLPVLRSREELNDLIAVMKLSKSIFPMEAIYIGLRRFHYSQVIVL